MLIDKKKNSHFFISYFSPLKNILNFIEKYISTLQKNMKRGTEKNSH